MFKLVWALTPLILKLPHTELTSANGCEQKSPQTPICLVGKEGTRFFSQPVRKITCLSAHMGQMS